MMMDNDTEAASGDTDHFRFHLPIRVIDSDLNAAQVADPNAYLRYMDRARVEAIEDTCIEVGLSSWLKQFVVNVYRVDLTCISTASVGDRLEVQTGVRKISSHRAAFDQRIVRLENGETVASAMVEVLFLKGDKELAPVPDVIKETAYKERSDKADKLPPIPFSDEAHFSFQVPLRVYYEDTDAQGITYHVSYLRFCRAALIELIQKTWEADPALAKHIMRCANFSSFDIRYLNSSSLGERLLVRTGARTRPSGSIAFDQRIVSMTTNKIVVDMIAEVEFKDERGRPIDIAEKLVGSCRAASG